MPKLKKSATSAILSAVSAARGSSIMVPTEYSMLAPARRTPRGDRSTWARVISSSRLVPTSGIMISGTGACRVLGGECAPSKIARACIS